MKKFLPVLVFTLLNYFSAQSQCGGGRYRDIIFQNYDLTSDIIYGNNINLDGESEDLKMDVYEPTGDTEVGRALVILCHGGYFLGGDKAEADMVPLCEDLSRMGYVVASINYRMGLPFALDLQEPYGQTLVRAVQDLRAAIRWFRKDAAENGNQYQIDPDNIFSGGSSAGGFMTLHMAYMDEPEIPSWLDMSIVGLEGGLEGESGNPGYSSDVKAIFSVSGAMGNSDWIDAEDTTPALLFHGDADNVVTIDSGMFTLLSVMDVTTIEGSNRLNEAMNLHGIEHCYEINEGMGHVAYLEEAATYDTTLSLISNFLSYYLCDVDLDCTYREISIGIDETKNGIMTLMPNPAHDKFMIQGKTHVDAIQVRDMQGRVVIFEKSRTTKELDISELSPGVYMVTVESEGAQETVRLIVH